MKYKIFLPVIIAFIFSMPIINGSYYSSTFHDNGNSEIINGSTIFGAEVKPDDQKKVEPSSSVNGDDEGLLIKVMAIILVIWIGISAYLFKIDRRVKKLEEETNEL